MSFVLLIVAFACFLLAAFSVSLGVVQLVPLGLTFMTAAMMAGAGWPWKAA